MAFLRSIYCHRTNLIFTKTISINGNSTGALILIPSKKTFSSIKDYGNEKDNSNGEIINELLNESTSLSPSSDLRKKLLENNYQHQNSRRLGLQQEHHQSREYSTVAITKKYPTWQQFGNTTTINGNKTVFPSNNNRANSGNIAFISNWKKQESSTTGTTTTVSRINLKNENLLNANSSRNRSTLVAASVASKAQSTPPETPVNPQRDPLDVSFNDPIAAFKSKTTWELMRAYVVYLLCSSEKLVEHNMQLMKWSQKIFGTFLFEKLMKATFYGHFVAGEDQIKILPTLERLRSFGVKPILDYSVEEDISQEEAEKREVESSTSSLGDKMDEDSLPQYHVNKSFADRRYKVQSARTYFYLNEATCERNMEIFIKCLEAVSGATFGTGITAIKLTALGRPQLLLQFSEVIMRIRKYMEELVGGDGNVLTHHKTVQDLERYYSNLGDNKDVKEFLKNVTSDKEGILHLFPWSGIVNEDCQLSDTFRVPDPKTGQMRRLTSQIPAKEEEMFRNMIRRLNTIVKAAADLDVRIMVDAEQTYFQPAISRITLEMMRKYNKDKAIVFNTYQCYLRETFREVCTDLEQAKRQNFYFGAKLVRGAYMEQERARAQALKYSDPINADYDATTEMYHNTLVECLRRIKILKDSREDAKKIGIMVASHNEDTVRFAIQKMKEIGIEPEDKVICFGQLLGMCDYITFPLGQAGYSAYKYIPYGPVQEVLPYLSRRAQENKGVLQKIKKEKRLLLAEIRRRVLRGQLFYTPKGNYVPI